MSWDAWVPEPKAEEDPTWGDYAKAAGKTVAGIGAGAAGALRQFYEAGRSEQGASIFRELQGMARQAGDDITESMTPEGRDRFNATFTSEKFWEHPVSGLALKATGMTPYLVAAAIPGALVGDAALAVSATAAAGGALSAGDVIEGIYEKTDKLNDKELQEQSTLYRGLRADFDETEARRQYNQTLLGLKPALAFALGVGTGAVGPAANIIRGIKGGARHGIGRSAAEGAVGEAVEEGSGDYSVQSAEVEGGLKKEIDKGQLVDAVLGGGVMGGLFGAATGVGGGKGKGKAKADEIAAKQGRGAEVAPVEAAPEGEAQPGAEPQRTAPEPAKKQVQGKVEAEVVEPGAPSVAEAAAINDLAQPTQPKAQPPEVPVPQQAPAPTEQFVQPPPIPEQTAQTLAPVTPEVTQEVTLPQAAPEVSAPVEQAPVQSSVPEPTPIAPAEIAPVAAPEVPVEVPTVSAQPAPAKATGRVLPNISPEAKAIEKAAKAKAEENLKAATAGEKVVGTKNLSPAEAETIAARGKHAEELVNEHHKERTLPVDRAERQAMANELGAVLDAAAKRGLVPRETLPEHVRYHFSPPKDPVTKKRKSSKDFPITDEERAQYHLSIPEKVGAEDMSSHVRYLREVMAIKKILEGQKYGPQSDQRARVSKFITESNTKDLTSLAERRKEEGAQFKRVDQGNVEEKGAAIGDAAREDTLSPEEKLIRAEEDESTSDVEIEQGPSVKHIEVKPVERIKLSAAEARAARKAALAGLTKKPKPEASISSALKTDVPDKLGSNGKVNAIKTVKARDALKSLNLEHLSGVPKAIAKIAQKRFEALVGDTDVHILDKYEMARATGDVRTAFTNSELDGVRGLATMSMADGKTVVLMRADQFKTPEASAHAMIHEIAHAATMRALVEDKALHSKVTRMMQETEAFLKDIPDIRKKIDYALSDEREFIAEAFSNPEVQEVLAGIPLSDKLAHELGLARRSTTWDAIVDTVRKVIEKVTGRIPDGMRMIEGVMRLGPEFEAHLNRVKTRKMLGQDVRVQPHEAFDSSRVSAKLTTADARDYAADLATNSGGKLRRAKDKLSSAWMMARRENNTFGPSRPLNRLFDERAKQEREKDRILNTYGGAEVTRAIAAAEREHPEAMAKAKEILFDASLHDVNLDGSNDHLGKDKLTGVQAKKQLPRLQKAWDDKSLDPVRETILRAVKFYRDIHNEVSRDTIKNILAEANIHDAGLADRIYQDGVTEADRDAWKNNRLVDALDQVKALKQRKGWYVPFRRYGEFISSAEHELAVPSNSASINVAKINDNTLQFDAKGGDKAARDALKRYLEQDTHTPQGNLLTPSEIRKVAVDKNDVTKIVEPEDPDAIPAYRVSMQTSHTEFHETEAAAVKHAQELSEQGLVNARNHKREEAYQQERNLQGAMGTILRSLEKQQRYLDADPQSKAAMREMFHDLTLGLSGNTTIKNSMKQRRNVAGMSRDLGRVTADYARMTANHLAKLRHRPQIDKIFAEMRDYMKAHRYDSNNLRREEVYQEFSNRIYGKEAKAAEEHKPGPIKRLLQMSRLSRLAGVSFHVINSHEPWVTSLPVIGGRHGFGQTMRMMADTYNMIGARRGVVAGLRDTAKAFKTDSGFTDYVKMFKAEIANSKSVGGDKARRLQDVLDYMEARNLYGNDSIFEVGKSANPNSNVAGRALDRADLMANQVGSAIEAINRTVTGLTAYNLEYRRNGGNHEAAMHYAYTTAHDTMGDYSSWNAAPVFNTKGGQLALQFKKFGHKTYYLLGKTIQGVIAGDREAMKQFAGLMVTHGMVAGALGLPTEPFKVALMAANMIGATGFTPEDYENAVRQLAARVAGQKGGEIISKGLYRGIGIEVSGRMGQDSLLTFGSPKSEKANDIKAWLFDTMAGAPAGYLLDQVAAAQALAKGDVPTAIQKASPVRAVGDIAKAVSGVAGPRVAENGREINPALTPWEATVRAVGFTPSSVAENGALRRQVASESKKVGGERTSLINAWVEASGAKKVDAQRAVQKFNAGQDKGSQITQKDLASAARRRETEKEEGTVKNGVKVSKRTKEIYDRAAATYNP